MFRKIQKLLTIVTMASFAFSFVFVQENAVAAVTQTTFEERQSADYGKTPLLFEQNKGQTDREVKYFAKANGYQLFLTQSETVFSLKNADQIKMSFVSANKNAELRGENRAITVSNYFSGHDQSKWLTGIPNFAKVLQKDVYQGVDVKYYGVENKQLEYDFVVSPNADANQIKLNFDGTKNVSINDNGDLVLKTENAELVQHKPIAYQTINGERRDVAVSYQLTENRVSFAIGEYDKSRNLIIDPVLSYLSYIGGTAFDAVDDIAVDAQGNAYITGGTESLNFHGKTRAANDAQGIFVGKLDSTGQNFLYLTILESNAQDGNFGTSIALDASGNAYITGDTEGRDYPITANAFQPRKSICHVACLFNNEAIVTKLDVNGAISYSTYLGGANGDLAFDIAVDSLGRAYVVGKTDSGLTFPKKNEFQGTGIYGSFDDAYLTVFNSDGSDIIYSTGFGGYSKDEARGVAVDSANNAYITGITASNVAFPVKNAFQTANAGGKDAFVAKFNPSLSGNASLIYSTFIGGSGTDEGRAIAVSANGQANITGVTGSANFPLANAFRTTNQINEAFVSVIGSTGTTLVNSSFLGGADQEQGDDIKLGNGGLIYVSGQTTSNNFPLALPFQATRGGLNDAFVTKLRFGSGVLSSSFLGGNAEEFGFNRIFVKGNQIYLAGETQSNNLATTSGVIGPAFSGGIADGYVAKILDTQIDSVGVFRPASTFILTQSTTNIVPQNATFTGGLAGTKGVSGDFDGDDIDTIGSFTNGTWKIRNSNFPTNPLTPFITVTFGTTGDLHVVGDWNGDGIDTVGVYRPSTSQFLLSNGTVNPQVEITQQFGIAEDLPVAGDWNGDGIDTIGVFRPSVGQFFLTNSTAASPTIDANFTFGLNGDLPIAGDFNGDGVDTISIWRPATTEFFISNDNATFLAPFLFGSAFTDQPIVGDWDGRPLP